MAFSKIMELIKRKKEVYCCFIDLSKAYDRINLNQVYDIIRKKRVLNK